MPPLRAQTGTPGFVGLTHFHSSTISGSALRMTSRTWLKVLPRQSPSSLIFWSIRSDALASPAMSLLRRSAHPRLTRDDVGGQSTVPAFRASGQGDHDT